MSDRGFIVIKRGMLEHPVIGCFGMHGKPKRELTELEAWIWMLEEASWRDREISVRGKTIKLHRGQFSHSVRFIADKFLWHRAKVSRFLTRLKTETMAETASETGQLTITICNYDRYQFEPAQAETASETPTETVARQQRDKEERIKKLNKQNARAKGADWKTEFDDVFWPEYPHRVGKGAARKAFKSARAKAGLTELMAGLERYKRDKPADVRWCHPSTWLNGERWTDEPAKGGNGAGSQKPARLDPFGIPMEAL